MTARAIMHSTLAIALTWLVLIDSLALAVIISVFALALSDAVGLPWSDLRIRAVAYLAGAGSILCLAYVSGNENAQGAAGLLVLALLAWILVAPAFRAHA